MNPDITLLLAVVGTLAAVVAAVQTHRAYRLNRRLVEAQGGFSNPNICVEWLGHNKRHDVLLAVPIAPKRIVEFPVDWTFTNTGNKTARDLEIFIRSHRDLWYGGSKNAKYTFEASVEKIRVQSVQSAGNLETLIITAGTLHSGQSFRLDSRISLQNSTFLQDTVTVQAKDGSVSVNYEVEFAYKFDIIITQADQRPSTMKFSLGVIDTYGGSVRKFLNEYNARRPKSMRRGIRRFWGGTGTRFTLIEVSPDQLLSDKKLPIDRLRDKASVKISNGIRFDDEYFLPAVGVSIGNTRHS